VVKLSVIVCTHNPRRDYLMRTLEALRNQTLPKDQWEMLLIDNASDAILGNVWDLSWHPKGRHIREDRLGVIMARHRGIKEASAPLLLFVDDDNVLVAEYLAEAVAIGHNFPQMGVWGAGRIIPEFEESPQPHLAPLLPYLALRDSPHPQWSNVFPFDSIPWSAGMCLRKEVAHLYLEYCKSSTIHLLSRIGRERVMMSGEDVEMDYVACCSGFGVGVFPQLTLSHQIPRERIAEERMLALYEGTIASNYLMFYKHTGKLHQPWPLKLRAALAAIRDIAVANGFKSRRLAARMYLARIRAALLAKKMMARTIRAH
jgi:glycosyltransferase involved in cell wall biosynthesis